MNYQIIYKKVLSCNGKNLLAGKVYLPEGDIKGYFHVVHGMTEHIGRYDKFMRELAENGYIAFGYDHLGHGYTAKDDSELGFIAERGGDDLLAHDVKVFSDAIRSEYGDYPYFLMGHSMGSFVVRMATIKYIVPDKLIIMGTGGPNPIAGIGVYLCKIISFFKGPRHISSLIDNIAFGKYNDRFKDEPVDKGWLTSIPEIREKYLQDKFCMFKFTISAMHDLISISNNCNSKAWFEGIANKTPILLLSGADDPVGDFGKGVTSVYEKLKEQGANVEIKLYENNRHEILNDIAYDQVVEDILNYIK